MAVLCGANARSTGKPCTQPVVPGGTRCHYHGGAAPRSKAAAERRRAEESARKILETYGHQQVDTNPIDALLEEVRWTAGHVAWLRERVRELEQDALVWGKVEEADKQATEFPGVDTTHRAVVHVWLDLYQRERKHLVDVCKAAISAGIEERRVKLAERQGQLLADVINRILDDLDLSADQRRRVSEVVPRHLRAVS